MAQWAPHLAEFKGWFSSQDGFGEYLRHFFEYYGYFFRDYQEDHMFVYTKLHKEFSKNLEKAIDVWLATRGMTQEDLGAMLEHAQNLGDQQANEIVDMLIGMLEYHRWIKDIFALKANESIANLLGDENVEQFFKPRTEDGWKKLGDMDVDWGTEWWENWTDAEWEEWWDSDAREQWDADWWEEKQEAWTDKEWAEWTAQEAAPEAQAAAAEADPNLIYVVVPDGVNAGDQLQVTAPSGQVLATTVPDGLGPGDQFAVSAAVSAG